ncbi:hypothetical protein [Rhizobacter sp. P5_C2]
MNFLPRLALLSAAISGLLLTSGCTTTASAIMSATGIATDTSPTWEIIKHFHAKLTEGDPQSCASLNSAQRALTARCLPFQPGSLKVADIRASGFQECTLTIAARDPQFWPVLPELLDKGAQPETCYQPPMVALARSPNPVDFSKASPQALRSLRFLAEVDSRAVNHDVVRLLSSPSARAAGLDDVIAQWVDQGGLAVGQLAFSPLSALHPSALQTPLAAKLEAAGHTAKAGLGPYQGKTPAGFEEALRTADYAALEWWFKREPKLVDKVPSTQGQQLPWIPLARVVVPTFMNDEHAQAQMVSFLMSHGANPWQPLPYQPTQTVVGFAKTLKSPTVALLEAPKVTPAAATVVANSAAVGGQAE